MKTCLVLTSLAVLSLHSLISAQDLKFRELIREADISITQSYTPFGSNLEFDKFGDDGSSCVTDDSGVLTWIDNTGAVRVLPNAGNAVPLYVTATECLVWNNRFAEHSSYSTRPKAQIKLFRAEPGSTTITEQTITTEGVEVLDTPPITTTSVPFTFITTTRKDNGSETPSGVGTVNNSDDCEIRVYRVTAGGGVQLLRTANLEVRNAPNFQTNTTGPDFSALSYGSDGSVAVLAKDVYPTRNATAAYFQQVLWYDQQGRSVLVNSTNMTTPPPVVKILSTSTTRIVYELNNAGTSTFSSAEGMRPLAS